MKSAFRWIVIAAMVAFSRCFVPQTSLLAGQKSFPRPLLSPSLFRGGWQPAALRQIHHGRPPRRPECIHPCCIAATVFEPMVPDLMSTVVVLSSTLGLAVYWWFVFVPSERRDLAKNKNKGGLNGYLADLEMSDDRKLERWFYFEWLERRRRVRRTSGGSADSLQREKEKEVMNAERDPNFLSLDNPVVIAAAILLSGVVFSAVSSR